jgi:hypothetical protein
LAMSKSRYYTDLTLKKLFALSRNVCAFPGCDIRFADPAWESVLADITHIEGLNKGSARFNPSLTDAEANAFENLMLMCKTHNWHIDMVEQKAWPVDKLRDLKASHEKGRSGDTAPDASLQLQFLVQLVAALGIAIESDEVQILDPSVGMRIMTEAIGELEAIEEQLGVPYSSMPIDEGWISYGFAAKERFQRAINEAELLPADQVGIRFDLARLRDVAMDAFGRIPGN